MKSEAKKKRGPSQKKMRSAVKGRKNRITQPTNAYFVEGKPRKQRPRQIPAHILTMETVAKALRANAGLKSHAAAALRVTPSTITRCLRRWPKLQQVCEEIVENTIDLAESKLLQSIKSGNIRSVVFYLKCKGKSRGYVERAEITGADGQPLSPTELELESVRRKIENALAGYVNDEREEQSPQHVN